MIDEALLRSHGLDRADRGLAESPDLELRAVDPREAGCAQAALPIQRVAAELGGAVAGVVADPKEARDTALHRVADVVDVEFISIRPSVEIANGASVVADETTLETVARAGLGHQTEGLLDREEAAGGANQRHPLDAGASAGCARGGQDRGDRRRARRAGGELSAGIAVRGRFGWGRRGRRGRRQRRRFLLSKSSEDEGETAARQSKGNAQCHLRQFGFGSHGWVCLQPDVQPWSKLMNQ